MKKIIFLLVFCLVVSLLVVADSVGDVKEAEFPVLLNGNPLNFEQNLVTINGSTYVPLRELADNLGINVVWNQEKQQVEMIVPKQEYKFRETGTKIDPIRVSIMHLIANPERYHDKYVQVIGVWNIEFEENCLYLTCDDWNYLNFKNAIWLNFGNEFFGSEEEKEAMLLNGKYVDVTGKFNATDTGHMGVSSGGLMDIRFYRSLSREEWIQMLLPTDDEP